MAAKAIIMEVEDSGPGIEDRRLGGHIRAIRHDKAQGHGIRIGYMQQDYRTSWRTT